MRMEKITPDSPEAQSADLVAENIEKLKALFPELITEGPEGLSVNVDVLKQLVGDKTLTDCDEKYSLNWFGKRRARQLALTPSTGTLRPAPEESEDWDTTQNLFIEGDNLEVLKLLQKSYAGKVKLIYIDPPYNTGKDFVYKDDFRDNIRNYKRLTRQVDEEGSPLATNTETSGRFHTDWLNMMYPRLKLARNLLREDGALFVSIDDGEVANLRKICDEIFGEENFIANVVWQKKYTRANDARWFSDNHDHILVYGRNKDSIQLNVLERSKEQLKAYSNPDNHPKGPWKATPLHAKSGSNTKRYTFKNGVVWTPPKGTFRRYNDESMKKMEENDEIWFGEDGKQVPQRKSFLCDVKSGVTPVTIWGYKEAGHNHEANTVMKKLGLGGIFDNPKPVRLVNLISKLITESNQKHIVLDFFAGSGTTGHAVFEQNQADDGNRRYILVQIPEPLPKPETHLHTLADITKERLRRAARKIKEEHPEWNGDTGFRVFKLDSSNIKAWNPNTSDLEADLADQMEHILPDRSEADLLYELLLKLGLDLCVPIEQKGIAGKTIHAIGGGVLMACLADKITTEDTEALGLGIAKWHKELAPAGDTTCVFLDSAFENDVAKTNLAAILEQAGIASIRSL